MIDDVRRHGDPPYAIAVLHGGPGAVGEMAPVARELASARGVLEPLQTARSIDGQVDELREVLEEHGAPPVVLVGYSWGAWLGFIVAARWPDLVRQLVLVSSGPFEDEWVAGMRATRRSRLGAGEREELDAIFRAPSDASLARLGELITKTDAYDPLPDSPDGADELEFDGDAFRSVWSEVAELRRSGALLELGEQIRCPVVAIHGDHDPHPAEGVRRPLARTLREFRMILLEKCGHTPWRERHARDAFFRALEGELRVPRQRPSEPKIRPWR